MTALRSDIHSLSSLDARQMGAWRELAAAAVVANPFAEPEVVLPAARRLHPRDAGLLVVEDGSSWRAALPVASVSRWRHVPGRWLIGWRHPYCYLGTPLLDPADAEGTLATLLRRAVREPGAWAFALERVDAAGPFGQALAAVLPAVGRAPLEVEFFERALLRRREVPDYLASAVSSRHRKELRRTRRLLEAEVGSLVVRDHAGDEQAPQRFLELERSGWKGRAGTAMAQDREHAALFADLCAGWRDAGRLQLLALESSERVVAMKCNVRAGDGSFCFKIAFDDALARFSPGIQLEVENIAAFHAGEAAWMDSCAASDNAMINRLWAERRSLQTLILSSSTVRGALGHGVWKAAWAGRDLNRHIATRRAHAPTSAGH